MALPIFSITLFLSAFLLFLVQPMVGKLILPRLGGTPQVWNTCIMFFQTVLLAGYGYTHAVSTRLPLKKQLLVHAILLFLPFIVLLSSGTPFDVSNWVPPPGANPIPSTLLLLTIVVGLPFFVVSTSAPLLQRWFGYTGDPAARDPYFLYAASNLGSLLALVAYPFVVEPWLTLYWQTWMWVGGYVAFAATVLFCVVMVHRAPASAHLAVADAPAGEPSPAPAPAPVVQASTAVKAGQPKPGTSRGIMKKKGLKLPPTKAPELSVAAATVRLRHEEPTLWRRIRWVLLAAAPSSLMLGVTSYVSTDLSPFPLLWAIPLALYLLTFILVFSRVPWPWTETPHTVVLFAQPLFLCALIFIVITHRVSPIFWITFLMMVSFFATALMCHGELARDRPSTKYLTEFYLLMSLGGMLGGVFNGLVAPVLFVGVVEFPLAIVLASLVRPNQTDQGWLDGVLHNALPDMRTGFRNWSASLAKGGLVAFLTILIMVGAGLALMGFLVGAMLDLSPFMQFVLYGLAIVGMTGVAAIRFAPNHALSIALDVLLALVVLCVSYFLRVQTARWGWLSDEVAENGLMRILKAVGLPVSWAVADRGPGIAYLAIVFWIPLLIAVFFSMRNWRFGLTIGAILMTNLVWVEDRRRVAFAADPAAETDPQAGLVHADRSYFGVLRVHQDVKHFFPAFIRNLEQITNTKVNIKSLPVPTRDGKQEEVYPVPNTYLMHGTTHHGLNYQAPQLLRRLATTYYHRKGPTGVIMERLNWCPGPQNTYWADNRMPAGLVGLGAAPLGSTLPLEQLVQAWSEPPYATIGLGTGTMASYGRLFQHVVFYEIDDKIRNFSLPPDMRRPYFNYLQDALKRGVNLEVIMGDARTSLQEELQLKDDIFPHRRQAAKSWGLKESDVSQFSGMFPGRERYYRVIEVDAFSSDAIPIHLITKEAIKLYFDKLDEHGVVCVHTSNRHVDLVQPVVDIAVELGLKWRVGKDSGRRQPSELGLFGSEYVMLSRHAEDLPAVGGGEAGLLWYETRVPNQVESAIPAGNRVWTDDYSNIVGIIRWW